MQSPYHHPYNFVRIQPFAAVHASSQLGVPSRAAGLQYDMKHYVKLGQAKTSMSHLYNDTAS